MDIEAMREQIERAVVATRENVVRYAREAEIAGLRKEANAWRLRLRRLDRGIAAGVYGPALQRNPPPA